MAGSSKQTNRNRELFLVEPGQRALLVGRTGSGKSTLGRYMLTLCQQTIIICDPKGDFDFPGCRVITDPEQLSTFRRTENKDVRGIIYRPDPEFDKPEFWEGFFEWCYRFRDCMLYIDEIFGVMRNNTSPHYLKAVLTRGRSLRISCIACTQRPFSIPVALLTECERRYMFALTLLDDLKRMAELMPGKVSVNGKEVPLVLTDLHGKHNFFFYNVYGEQSTKEFCLVIGGRRNK